MELADNDIKENKARIIKQTVLDNAEKQVRQALTVHGDFQEFQSKVLKESLLPSKPKA